jgi:ADP-ribose pyrophosphatase YjhB (NUDIX family)
VFILVNEYIIQENMHIYQKKILDQLRINRSQKYSQLQPDDVESSHFKYHLNQLIIDGLVEKEDRGVYKLTTKGKSEVDKLSLSGVNKPSAPKVITYTLIEDEENYYLFKKDKEPYIDLLNLIGGKVHLGELSFNAAKRELTEKINFMAVNIKPVGIAEIVIKSDQQIMSHVVAYVFVATINKEAILDNLIKIKKDLLSNIPNLAPDTFDIIREIDKNTYPFWTEIIVDF